MNELILRSHSGDREALRLLLEQNYGLVYSAIARFTDRGISREELFQIGCLGLIKAIRGFDPSRGFAFSTYAVPLIFGELKQFFRSQGAVSIGRRQRRVLACARQFEEEWRAIHHADCPISVTAQAVGVEAEELLMLRESAKSAVSDDACRPDPTDYFEPITEAIALRQTIAKLEQRERRVILLRYFRRLTQQETAARLHCSQAEISRSEKKILQKLKEIL